MRKTKEFTSPVLDPPSEYLYLLTGWMEQGIESVAATQQIFAEAAMRQNTAAAKTLREGLTKSEDSSLGMLTDLAIKSTSSFIEAQQILLTLAQQEQEIVMSGANGRVAGSTRWVGMTNLVRRSFDTLLRMQQEFLTTTHKQTLKWLNAIKARRGFAGDSLIELAQRDLENFVEAQKKFLDRLAEETARAASRKEKKNPRKSSKVDLPKLARAATNAFVDAQKRLVSVVSHQLRNNTDAVTRTLELASKVPFLPLADLAGDGVKEFVGAERALLETIVKPTREAKFVKASEHRPGRALHPKRAEKPRVARAGG